MNIVSLSYVLQTVIYVDVSFKLRLGHGQTGDGEAAELASVAVQGAQGDESAVTAPRPRVLQLHAGAGYEVPA